MSFLCESCKKSYKTIQSRYNHIKKYHIDNVIECKFCKKPLSNNFSRWRHEKTCTNNNFEMRKETEEIKQEIIEIKNLLKSLKIHPKKLQKINNQLNNNGTINNNTINIVQLGYENLDELLSEKEKIKILNKKAHSLRDYIDMVHISNKFNQFKNVYITNLQNNIGYKFDSKANTFIAVNKSDLLDDIIDCRMYDIEQFYKEIGDKLDNETSKIIDKFITRMNNDDDKLKGIKKEEIKLLLYNSREKINLKTIDL